MPVIARGLRNLENLQRQIRTAPQMAPEVAKRIGAALVKQVSDQFRQSVNPYGEKWKPIQPRNRKRDRRARAKRAAAGLSPRTDKPLLDTGRLRASVNARVSGPEVRISLPVAYASYHDQGTRRIPRRQILPDPGNLGEKWQAAIDKEARRVVKDHFGG